MSIALTDHNTLSILEHSRIVIDDGRTPLETLIAQKRFSPYHKSHINIGMRPQTVWIEFTLHNQTKTAIAKTLVLGSPMLEHIAFYEAERLNQPRLNGRYHNTQDHTTLFYRYVLTLAPHTQQRYYLEVRSDHAPVSFGLSLETSADFISEDSQRQTIAAMLIAAILALGLYNFFVSFYTRDRSYFYYSMYLFALIAQQATYLGLTQVYLPPWLNAIDIRSANIQGAVIIVFSALFAIHFLKTSTMPWVHRTYKLFIVITVVQVALVYLLGVQNMQALALIALLYVSFTLIAGILSYRKGTKQARLFILGFFLLFTSYVMLASDALGWTSVMHTHRSLLAWGTAIDALILSLAFADRYAIMQRQKVAADRLLLDESKNREKIIQVEVVKKTAQLNAALESKETLLQEVHHRVKNNLQVILSIVRLQNDEMGDKRVSEKFDSLEYRISAIAKSYDMLILKEDLREIDMNEYIESLLEDIEEMYRHHDRPIEVIKNIHAVMPLKESVYVGLIINELVNNAYKHAFGTQEGMINITLTQKKQHYTLQVEDDGQGYTLTPKNHTLGLKLIHTLVEYQLEGTMEQIMTNGTHYIIRFSA